MWLFPWKKKLLREREGEQTRSVLPARVRDCSQTTEERRLEWWKGGGRGCWWGLGVRGGKGVRYVTGWSLGCSFAATISHGLRGFGSITGCWLMCASALNKNPLGSEVEKIRISWKPCFVPAAIECRPTKTSRKTSERVRQKKVAWSLQTTRQPGPQGWQRGSLQTNRQQTTFVYGDKKTDTPLLDWFPHLLSLCYSFCRMAGYFMEKRGLDLWHQGSTSAIA